MWEEAFKVFLVDYLLFCVMQEHKLAITTNFYGRFTLCPLNDCVGEITLQSNKETWLWSPFLPKE